MKAEGSPRQSPADGQLRAALALIARPAERTPLRPTLPAAKVEGVSDRPAIVKSAQGPTDSRRRHPVLMLVAVTMAIGVIVLAGLRTTDVGRSTLTPKTTAPAVTTAPTSQPTVGSGSSPANWLSAPPPPSPWVVGSFAAIAVGGEIVEIGATSDGGTAIQEFDVVSSVWTSTRSPIMVGDGGTAAAAVTDRLLIFRNGAFDFVDHRWLDNFVPQDDPNDRFWSAAWTGIEAIFLPAGLAYNPTLNTWRRLPNTPSDLGGTNVVWTGSEILAAQRSGPWYAYTPRDDRWRELSNGIGPQASSLSTVWDGSRLVSLTATREISAFTTAGTDNVGIPPVQLPVCDEPPSLLMAANGQLVARSACDGGKIAILRQPNEWAYIDYPVTAPPALGCPAIIVAAELYDPCAHVALALT